MKHTFQTSVKHESDYFKCIMYTIRAEQADASNYCNLQGSNSSLKYISPYWKKGIRISSKMRGSKLTGSWEAAAIWKITATTCCKSGGFHFANSFHCAVQHKAGLDGCAQGRQMCTDVSLAVGRIKSTHSVCSVLCSVLITSFHPAQG